MNLRLADSVPTAGGAVFLQTKSGLPYVVDSFCLSRVLQYGWHPRKSRFGTYLYRKKRIAGKTKYIAMHRWLIHAKPGLEVHHRNGNTLDNRLQNLELLTPEFHASLHRNRRK